MKPDLALDPKAGNQVVHSVEASQKRALAAARRPNQGRDLVLRNGYGDIAQSLGIAIEYGKRLRAEHRIGVGARIGWRQVGRCHGN